MNMDNIVIELTMEERSCLRHFLNLKIGQLSEAVVHAKQKDCPAIADKMDSQKEILVSVLSKLITK